MGINAAHNDALWIYAGLCDAGKSSRDGEACLLAAAAVEAARLNAGSAAYWNSVVRRAQDVRKVAVLQKCALRKLPGT